jgi:glycyl-tRNA synthetase
MEHVDEVTGDRCVPYVVECSAGLSRAVLTYLVDAFTMEEKVSAQGKVTRRNYLRLHPLLAPVKVGILPLSKDPSLLQLCDQLCHEFVDSSISARLDVSGRSIGKKYARFDEIGTPWCVVVDFDTLKDQQVTIRDRDSTEQVRLPLRQAVADIQKRLEDLEKSLPVDEPKSACTA